MATTNKIDINKKIENIIQGKEKINKEQMIDFLSEINVSLPVDVLDEKKAKCLAALSKEEILFLWHDYVNHKNAKLLIDTKNLVIKNLSEEKLQAIMDRFPEELLEIAKNGKLTPKVLGSFLDGLKRSANRAQCEQMLGQLFRDKTLQKNLNMADMFGVLADKLDSFDMLGDWGQKELSNVISPYLLNQAAKNDPKIAKLFLLNKQLLTAKSYEFGKIKLKEIDGSLLTSLPFFNKIVELSREKFMVHFNEMTSEYSEQSEIPPELKKAIANDLEGILKRLEDCRNEYLKIANKESKTQGV